MDTLQDVKETLDSRNKMVRLGDRSGWDVVDDYLGDSIASGSEDERKIKSPEEHGFRKRRMGSNQQPFRQMARGGKWPRARPEFPTQPREVTGFNSGSAHFLSYGQQQYNEPTSSDTAGFRQITTKAKIAGTCFYCGKSGHWASSFDQRRK